MMPINAAAQEEAIIELLQRTGPCCLDDVVTYLPDLSWGEVFVAVDRMSRDGRLLLRQLGYSAYQIALRAQSASTSSHSGKKGPQPRLLLPRELT
jgi:hypothetical protein